MFQDGHDCMDAGGRTNHDCMEAGGRTNQETESRMFQDGHDCMDAGDRATQEHLPGCKWSKTSGTSFPAKAEDKTN